MGMEDCGILWYIEKKYLHDGGLVVEEGGRLRRSSATRSLNCLLSVGNEVLVAVDCLFAVLAVQVGGVESSTL